MKILEIAFVGYPVTDLKRARRFYEQALGLTVTHSAGTATTGWIEYDIGASTLSIGNGAPDWKPSANGGAAALEVDDLAEVLQRLKAHGHPPATGPFETPVCHMAVVHDPDGNSIIIHKRKSA